MGSMASKITSFTIVYLTVYSNADKRKTSKLRVTGLCAGNSPVTGEFPAQMASNAENVSIWLCHHGFIARLVSFWTKIDLPLIYDVMRPMWHHCNDLNSRKCEYVPLILTGFTSFCPSLAITRKVLSGWGRQTQGITPRPVVVEKTVRMYGRH